MQQFVERFHVPTGKQNFMDALKEQYEGGNSMQRQNYMITAEEVAESMQISLGYAYKLLRKLNKELADQGYVIVAGKIPRAFWEKKLYGYSQIAI